MLYNPSWKEYRRLLRALQDRRLRLTYERGVLEIMSPTRRHDKVAYLLGRFIDTLTEELSMAVTAGRSMTLRNPRRKRGLEPDNSYWIASEPQIRFKEEIDLRIDPPPDLAMEIDVTRSSLNRMKIYAKLGVPELWRLTKKGLTFYSLQAGTSYVSVTHSLAFPMLTPSDVMQFLALRLQHDDNAVVRQFRDWVRQNKPAASLPQNP